MNGFDDLIGRGSRLQHAMMSNVYDIDYSGIGKQSATDHAS